MKEFGIIAEKLKGCKIFPQNKINGSKLCFQFVQKDVLSDSKLIDPECIWSFCFLMVMYFFFSALVILEFI